MGTFQFKHCNHYHTIVYLTLKVCEASLSYHHCHHHHIIVTPLQMGTPRLRERKPADSDPTVNKWMRQNSQPGLLTLNSTLSREEHLYLL